mgnify:CR=1 FL=1
MNNMKKEVDAFKTFHAASAAYILGEKSNVVLKGSAERIHATRGVLHASRALYEELNNSKATISTVASHLDSKRKAAEKFHAVTGVSWLL